MVLPALLLVVTAATEHIDQFLKLNHKHFLFIICFNVGSSFIIRRNVSRGVTRLIKGRWSLHYLITSGSTSWG
jgi:hypothetical protein